jgi:hypothetical protein
MELIRIVKLFSGEWRITSDNIRALEQDYLKHWFVLDAAIRKMTVLENRLKKEKAEYALRNWIRVAKKVLFNESVEQGAIIQNIKDNDDAAALIIANAYNKRLSERVMLLNKSIRTNKFLKEIQENILDVPQEVQLQRDELSEFIQLFKKFNPGYEYLTRYFVGAIPRLEYISTRSGTFKLPTPKYTDLKRSKSFTIENSKMKEYKSIFIDYLAWKNAPNAKVSGNPFRVRNILLRANSFNCKYDVGNLRSEVSEPSDLDAFVIEDRWLKGHSIDQKESR